MSKVKHIIESDKAIVEKQFLSFQELYKRIEIINIVSNYVKSQFTIGRNINEHINYNNYKEVSKKVLSDGTFTILLLDNSFINMYYEFDTNNSIIKHVLSFVPSYMSELMINNKKFVNNAYDENQEVNILNGDFDRRINNYIRVDFDENGKEDYYHSIIHVHFGVFKDGIRVPLENIMYPCEFLFLIFKYIYHYSDDKLQILDSNHNQKVLLGEKERIKFRAKFGINN